MTPKPCPRLFQAEALRDGRLAGAELASFERHLSSCADCTCEVQALDALAEPLRTSPEQPVDELHARRERTRLLAAFDHLLVTPKRRWGARRLLVFPVVVTALVTCVFIVARPRPTAQRANTSMAVVRADGTATWSKRTESNREQVILERGSLQIHVDHSLGAGQFVVVLPDGELEDTGTTFTVSAEDGHTRRVAVEEGSVVLRIRGKPPVTIGTGAPWILEANPSVSAVATAALATEPTPSRRQAALTEPTLGTPLAIPTPIAPQPRSTDSRTAGLPDSSLDYRAAMTALDVGNNREAADGFARFLVKHPRNARAEDAAYLRVIALQRCGDSGSMKQAAQEYLRRYPAGFRHTEVEILSR